MNLLLDTHAILWFAAGDGRLSSKARSIIESPDTVNYISIVSCWEMAVKVSLGKLRLDMSLQDFIDQRVDEGFRILPIETQHLPALTTLPFHHRDPFDRLLICQAIEEKMLMCTGDIHFNSYPVKIVW